MFVVNADTHGEEYGELLSVDERQGPEEVPARGVPRHRGGLEDGAGTQKLQQLDKDRTIIMMVVMITMIIMII